jgi:predicted DNA-binding transcriptional regulator AlpA
MPDIVMRPAPTPAAEPDPLLSVDQVSRWLGKPKATLYAWRSRGLGPRAIRVGNVLRYRRSEVETWLDANTDDRR